VALLTATAPAEVAEDPAEDTAEAATPAALLVAGAAAEFAGAAAGLAGAAAELAWAAAEAAGAAAGLAGAAAEADEDPLIPAVAGRAGICGRGGICAADAGRAKMTATIKASMKSATRPPQAYRHSRRGRNLTLDGPTLERITTSPSTVRKPRQTLRYLAITLSARGNPVAASAYRLV
jgi:hypothetical protein